MTALRRRRKRIMEHPADDVLLRFLLGAASRQENRAVVTHLLARCPRCAAALRQMKLPPVDPAAYDEALDRFAAEFRKPLRGDERCREPRPNATQMWPGSPRP